MNVDDFLDTAADESPSGEVLDINKETTLGEEVKGNLPPQFDQEKVVPVEQRQVPQELKAETHYSAQDLVNEVDSLISQEKIALAMEKYGKLSEFSRRIPPTNLGARAAVNQQLVILHKKIQDKISSLKDRFVNGSQNIIILLQSAKTSLKANDLAQAKAIFAQINQRFAALPDEFSEQKGKLQAEIVKAQLMITSQEKASEVELFKLKKQQILLKLDAAEASIIKGENKAAVDLCAQIEQEFHNLPEGFLDEKTRLYDNILKKKTAAEIALQIQLLQQEFNQNMSIPSSAPSPIVSKVSSSETLPRAIIPSSFEESKRQSLPHPASIPSVHLNEIDGALRRVKISKIRLDLVENRLHSAESTCLELLDMFPQDYDVLAVKALVEKHIGHPLAEQHIPEHNVEVVRTATAEDDKVQIDGDSNVGQLKVKLRKKPSHAKLSEAIIHRRISLAKQQIQSGQVSDARATLSKVLEKEPNNEDAKKLFHLVS